MGAYDTRDQYKRVRGKQPVAKGLLALAYRSRSQPIRVGDSRWLNHMDSGRVRNFNLDKGVGDDVESMEPLMYPDFHNRGSWIDGGVKDSAPRRTPASTDKKSAFASLPR
jgi:hypothetical protein